MKKFTRIFVYFLAFSALIACSSDDDKPSGEDNEIINGGTIHTYEVVTLEGEGYTQSTYEATFNGNAVQLDNDTEGGLVFMVQPGMAAIGGDNLLEVPSLDLKVTYRVEETVLEAPAEETLAPLIEEAENINLDEFDQGSGVAAYIASFNAYYASLEDSDKEEMAKFYMANAALFNGTANRGGQGMQGLSDCAAARLLMGGLAVATYYLAKSGPTVKLSIVTGLATVAAFANAVNTCQSAMDEKIKNIFTKFGDQLSSRQMPQHRGGGNALEFTSGESTSFGAANGMRGIQASDAGDSNPLVAEFFESVAAINDLIINKLNVAIATYNDYAPSYFALEPFGQAITVPQSSEPAELEMTQEMFGNFTFSAGSGVQLGSVAFNNGMISIMLTATDPEQEETSTTLNYTYQDEYNNRQGSFNVVVYQEVADCSGLAVTATADGNSATATAAGGQPPYTYSWSNGSTGATVSGLAEGEYIVTVTDANGCTASGNVYIENTTLDVLEGVWKIDLTLGAGECNETLIMDEMDAILQFEFNQNGTITFLNDPAGMDLNSGYYNQMYQWMPDENYLEISIYYYDFENDENSNIEIQVYYNEANDTFSGTYSNTWSDGTVCQNTVAIFR